MMSALEERRQSYLFKLKITKNVKRHIERLSALSTRGSAYLQLVEFVRSLGRS